MGWIDKKSKHTWCNKPSTTGVGVGSIWECDECKQRWMFLGRKSFNSPDPRENYEDIWERVSELAM